MSYKKRKKKNKKMRKKEIKKKKRRVSKALKTQQGCCHTLPSGLTRSHINFAGLARVRAVSCTSSVASGGLEMGMVSSVMV